MGTEYIILDIFPGIAYGIGYTVSACEMDHHIYFVCFQYVDNEVIIANTPFYENIPRGLAHERMDMVRRSGNKERI
jgi:hypothetical protein